MTDFFQKRSTIVWLSVITIAIVSIFAKTIFFGKPISKTFATSSMDSLYYPEVKSVSIYSPIDPCIYFFQVPTAIAIERIWKEGQIPLWNPNNACGHPVMANIESCVFSWHHFLFPSSSEYLYNLGIVARLIVAAIGTYFLSRSFKIQSGYAAFAGLTYALCPHILREVELTKENWCYPWILLLFISCGKQPSLKHLTILAASCGLLCATIHPECSFNLIMLGCFMVTLQTSLESTSATILDRLKTAMASVSWLLLVGICVFCVAAPVLLPFAEFMRNSDCYKFEECTPPVVSLQALLLTLIHPAMSGASPFLSIFAIPASLLAFYKPRREVLALLICTLLTIATESLVGPLSELFKHKPFNMLEPIYLLPVCMLLLACLMAEGFQKLATSKGMAPLILFSTACLVVVAIPPIIGNLHVSLTSLDWEVDKYTLVWSAWKRDGAIALTCCLLLALSRQRQKLSQAVVIVMIAGLISQLSVARLSLPTHDSFVYQPAGPVPWLQQHPGRSLAMGRHFIIPNINMVWNLSDFRHFNGLYAPRYLDFQSLCGGRRYFATHYRYEDSLTPAINLASVKYITSRSPIYTEADLASQTKEKPEQIVAFNDTLSIESSSVKYDPMLRQALCLLWWNCNADLKKDYKVQFAVIDAHNREIWSSDDFQMSMRDDNVTNASQVGRWSIPKETASAQPLKLVIRVNNLWSNQPLWPTKTKIEALRNNAVVAIFDDRLAGNSTVNQTATSKHFRLLEESADHSRIYENIDALPEAYSIDAKACQFVSSKEEARQAVTEKSFEGKNTVILENKEQSKSPAKIKCDILPAQIKRKNSNHVEITVDCPEPSYLVLTDTFYPGWKAYLNNSKEELEILRANYLFRAVQVPKGKSLVTFKYQPQSFRDGLILLCLVFSCIATLYFYKKVKSRNSAK